MSASALFAVDRDIGRFILSADAVMTGRLKEDDEREQSLRPLTILVNDQPVPSPPSIRRPHDDGTDQQLFAVLTVKPGASGNSRQNLEIRALPELPPGDLNNNAGRHRASVAPSTVSPVSDLGVEEVLQALSAVAAAASPLSSARTSDSDLSCVEPLIEPLLDSQDVSFSGPHPSVRLPTPTDLLATSARLPASSDLQASSQGLSARYSTPSDLSASPLPLFSSSTCPWYDGHVGLLRNDTGGFVLRCARSSCLVTFDLSIGRKKFKSCHSCHTYYCSRQCRASDWATHKGRCPLSSTGSACKRAIRRAYTGRTLYQLSRVARTGYLALGRGCLLLLFRSPAEAQLFVKSEASSESGPRPVYISVRDLDAAGLSSDPALESVASATRYYDPETQFVLNVAVGVAHGAADARPRRRDRLVKKCATVTLGVPQLRPIEKKGDGPAPMILTNQLEGDPSQPEEAKRQRQVFFTTVQRRLRERGVNLRTEYPQTFNQLVRYVESGNRFPAQTIYPVDRGANQRFMCMIMPSSDPLMQWVSDPATIKELDLSFDLRRRFSLLETDL